MQVRTLGFVALTQRPKEVQTLAPLVRLGDQQHSSDLLASTAGKFLMYSLGRLTPGHASYFEGEVADGREDYYSGAGEEPGTWRGRGARAAGLHGEVLEGQLARLFEQVHPVTLDPLGSAYKVSGTYVDRFGNEKVRHKIAAIDATFSAPKSVSELFALGDEQVASEVRAALDAAVEASLAHLDEHAAFSRAGKAGARQVDTAGLIAATYVHRTSRALDPQLHMHVLISNRVRCSDGKWRALDGRPLHSELKTAGMVGQAALRAELTNRLGVEWGQVTRHGQAEIVGVPVGLLDLHSKRTRQVEASARRAIQKAELDLARQLTPAERAQKFDAAALATRAVKSRHHSEEQGLRQRWLHEARDAGFDPSGWLTEAMGRVRRPGELDEPALVFKAISALAEQRSTWTRTHAMRELARLLPDNALASASAVRQKLEELSEVLLAEVEVVRLTSPHMHEGGSLRVDGLSESEPHGSAKFTTMTTLEREANVLDHVEAGRGAGLAVVRAAVVDEVVEEHRRSATPLSGDQVDAVRRITQSGEAFVSLVGPAGSGKSATLGVVAAAMTREGIPIRGLAVSAVAAGVLREEAGIKNSDTLAKLLHEQSLGRQPDEKYSVKRGEVLIVDEASMVSSADFARLVALARESQAKIVAVGDYRQLGAVDAGGLFRMVAARDAAELGQVWRFSQNWEREASLLLRGGDPASIEEYDAHGRVLGGQREEMLESAWRRWTTARVEGREAIVMASDRATVAEFNDRAREALIEAGDISSHGVVLGSTEISVGDEILSLRNDRRLLTGDGGFVRNGDRWRVLALTDEAIRIESLTGRGTAWLPSGYARAGHVAHAYATTVHKAEGVTVDEGILIVDGSTTSESLYVGMTRGRDANIAAVVCEAEFSEFAATGEAPEPMNVLAAALSRQSAEVAATEVLSGELDRADVLRARLGQEAEPVKLGRERLRELLSEEHRSREALRVLEAEAVEARNRASAALADAEANRRDLEAAQRFEEEALGALNSVDSRSPIWRRRNTAEVSHRRSEANAAERLRIEAHDRQESSLLRQQACDSRSDEAQGKLATGRAELVRALDDVALRISLDGAARAREIETEERPEWLTRLLGRQPVELSAAAAWDAAATAAEQHRVAWAGDDSTNIALTGEASAAERHSHDLVMHLKEELLDELADPAVVTDPDAGLDV